MSIGPIFALDLTGGQDVLEYGEMMEIKKWPALKPGDLVEVIAPGGKPEPGTLQGVKGFLESWGLKARMNSDLVGKDLFCSNSRIKRMEFLKKALKAQDSKMIWCLRGGYGAFHLLEGLGKIKAPPPIKCFLGFSDITSLHSYFNQSWGWATLHGPHIDRWLLGKGTALEAKRLQKVLFGEKTELEFPLKPLNKPGKRTLKSALVGGNLMTLQASFGTPFQIKTEGKILFLEEVGERAYRVDRVLEQMRQLGLFKKVKALVLGQFTEGREARGKNLFPGFFREFAKGQRFPVLRGLPCGHGSNQQALALNTEARLEFGSGEARLSIQTGVRG